MAEGPEIAVAADRTWLASLVHEWVAPPPQSDWVRRANDDRIVNQDRIRPYVARGVLLVAMVVCLGIADRPRWWWLLLAVGVLQTTLEMLYEPATRSEQEAVARRTRRGRWIIDVYYWNYQHGITNVTGLVGLVACVANLVVVTFGSGPAGDHPWLKVLALVCAVLYTASGALGPLLDTAVYDPTSRLPVWAWVALRSAWLLVAGAIVVAVLLSERSNGAWGDALPFALLACGLAYYPMLRVREYERALGSGERVARREKEDHDLAVARDLHHLLQPVKSTLVRARDALAEREARAAVDDYLDDMDYVYRAARERRITARDGLVRPLEPRLRKVAEAAMVELDVDLRLDGLPYDTDYRLAKQCLITLVENSVQAYGLWRGPDDPRVTASAVHADGVVVVQVGDLLPPITDVVWSDSPTLCGIRTDVERRGGVVEQVVTSSGKTVRARWRPRTELRTRTTDTEED